MATAKQFLKLSGGTNECEVGPFDEVSFGSNLYVNGSSTSAAWYDPANGYWEIQNGAELGNEHLTGNEYSIILGQAKLVE